LREVLSPGHIAGALLGSLVTSWSENQETYWGHRPQPTGKIREPIGSQTATYRKNPRTHWVAVRDLLEKFANPLGHRLQPTGKIPEPIGSRSVTYWKNSRTHWVTDRNPVEIS